MTSTQESVCKVCPHREDSIFGDLTADQLDAFCDLKQVSSYKKTQHIFYEGEPNLGLFILCSGRVKLSRTSRLGRRQITGITEPCGLLEEKDLFLGNRHTVTVEAMEDCVVCFVEREGFLEFLRHHPTVSIKVIERLSRELEQAEEKVEALTVLDVKKRLADLLLKLAGRHGQDTAEGRLIGLHLTREELAEMMGTTQETVIRVLSGFKKEQLIQDWGRQILLTNPERLKRIAT